MKTKLKIKTRCVRIDPELKMDDKLVEGYFRHFKDGVAEVVSAKEHFAKFNYEMFRLSNLQAAGVDLQEVKMSVNIPLVAASQLEHSFEYLGTPPIQSILENAETEVVESEKVEPEKVD